MTSVYSVEQKVFELEQIRIVIRKPKFSFIEDYNFNKACPGNTEIKNFVKTRLGLDLSQVEVITGNGSIPHPRMTMDSVRNSYMLNNNA